MKNMVGQPVEGSSFFGREEEIKAMWRYVENGHVLLSAPRRVGKTSLMFKLRNEPMEGWKVLHRNMESCLSPAQFVASLIATVHECLPEPSFWEKLRFWKREDVKKLFKSVGQVNLKFVTLDLAKLVQDSWQEAGRQLIENLGQIETSTLFVLDEFPIFIERMIKGEASSGQGPKLAEHFLHWFRDLRQGLDEQRAQKVRFLLGGSIGLDAVLSGHSLSATVNDLQVFSLNSFTKETSKAFLVALGVAESMPLSPDTIERILERLSWYIPFHLQLIFSRLLDHHKIRSHEPTPERVDEIYDRELREPVYKKYFAHWDERLGEALNVPLASMARILLSTAAKDPHGVSEDSLIASQLQNRPGGNPSFSMDDFRKVRDILLHDGYLMRHEEEGELRYRFTSSLLRDWWNHWYRL